MLTDGFSPTLVARGVTERVLSILLERTSIRILTKNAVVGPSRWLRFFEAHRDRFVVGLSIGSLGRPWARAIERRTSSPTARLTALRSLQDAGVPTYGMLCPVFPATLGDDITALVEQIPLEVVEEIWAEPYNDRLNWRRVRDAFAEGSFERAMFEAMFDGTRFAAPFTHESLSVMPAATRSHGGPPVPSFERVLEEWNVTLRSPLRGSL
jgi:DNA repair photolyase